MLGRKVIYVRCINWSYNNVSVFLINKKAILVYTGKNFMQVRAFERYIPLMVTDAPGDVMHKTMSELCDKTSKTGNAEIII